MNFRETYSLDDLLLSPKFSDLSSRSEVNLSVKLGQFTFSHPIIPSNMKSIQSPAMIEEIIKSGGLAMLHRFMPIEEQYQIAKDIISKYSNKNFSVSVGVKKEDHTYIKEFYDIGVRIFCIDIAHGHSQHCYDMIKTMNSLYRDILIIAGNVATKEGARYLYEAGANVIKINIGNGSICSTRIETGNGVPQMTAIMDAHEVKLEMEKRERAKHIDPSLRRKFGIISDGGCRSAGDCVKILCFADMIMTGNMFSGALETDVPTKEVDGVTYKQYQGSSTHRDQRKEGVVGWVKSKGNYESILTKILQGLQSGCSYQGVTNLIDLKKNPEFVKISGAGATESKIHDLAFFEE